MSPNPRQGGTAPMPRGVRLAAPPTMGGAPHRRRGPTAVPSHPVGQPGLDSRVALVGGGGRHGLELPRCSPTRGRRAAPDRRAVPPRGAARPPTAAPLRRVRGPGQPCRLIPVKRHGPDRPHSPCGRGTAVPSLPWGGAARTAVPLLSSVGRHGSWSAASPVVARPRTAVSLRSPAERHGSRAARRPGGVGGSGSRVALRWGRRAARPRRSCRARAADRRGVGPTVPSALHPRAARYPPRTVRTRHVSQALTKRCR